VLAVRRSHHFQSADALAVLPLPCNTVTSSGHDKARKDNDAITSTAARSGAGCGSAESNGAAGSSGGALLALTADSQGVAAWLLPRAGAVASFGMAQVKTQSPLHSWCLLHVECENSKGSARFVLGQADQAYPDPAGQVCLILPDLYLSATHWLPTLFSLALSAWAASKRLGTSPRLRSLQMAAGRQPSARAACCRCILLTLLRLRGKKFV
jgi:hypothetical protein